MAMHLECMSCFGAWEWDDKDVFNFDIPMGKRVWPSLCAECKEELETKYKMEEITRTQLIIEFSKIAGRIAQKCAGRSGGTAVAKLKEFKPKKRGKHDH